jgi:anti-sigma B factor antagonist
MLVSYAVTCRYALVRYAMHLESNLVDCFDCRILILTGEIDVHTGPKLRAQVFELLDENTTPLLIDMTGVAFCDSAGLAVAAAAQRHARLRGCPLALVGLSDRVNRVFEVTGLDRFVATYPTLADAARDLTDSDQP